MTAPTSAGLLLFRTSGNEPEVFLAHPGGPYWQKKDTGVWTIPKGVIEVGEDPLEGACREFKEETGIDPEPPYLPLGSIRQKSGKIVIAWAFEGDADERAIVSNTMKMIWPPNSGRWLTVPEIDRCEWFGMPLARRKIIAAQEPFLDRLLAILSR